MKHIEISVMHRATRLLERMALARKRLSERVLVYQKSAHPKSRNEEDMRKIRRWNSLEVGNGRSFRQESFQGGGKMLATTKTVEEQD